MIVEIKGWVGRESEENIKEHRTKGARWMKVLVAQASDLNPIPAII